MSVPVAFGPANALPTEALAAELDAAAGLARAEKAAATRKAYRADFAAFEAWCARRKVAALPADPSNVAAFLAAEVDRGFKPSTIGRRLAAIRYAHKLAGLPTPTDDERVRATMRGIRRTLGAAPLKKTPATAERVIAMTTIGKAAGLIALRDRALLLLGFAGAFRRSELVALDVSDIEETAEGLRITIRRAKTDQEGHGAKIAIVRGSVACPVAALKAWRNAGGISEGAVFRPIRRGGNVQNERLTDRSVANIIKAHAARVGLDPSSFSGHSLRAGFLTSAAKRGANLFKMMETSRHKSLDTLRGYVRDAELFRDHAGAGLL